MTLKATIWLVLIFWGPLLEASGQPAGKSPAAAAMPSVANQRLAEKAAATNAPYKIAENRILEFTLPLGPAARLGALNSKNPAVEYAKAAIAVPSGFEPEIPTPILVVTGTSDGDGSSIRPMRAFTNIALRLGWIVIAADGPFGKPPQDVPAWRWAMLSTLLEHIHKTWPASKRWPIATAGFSGGGKWAGVMGAILSQKDYNLIGVLMIAVNQDLASEAAKIYDPAIRYKQVPIYVASGTDDKIATPEHHQQVKESLLNSGFSTVRLETFKGGHAPNDGEIRKALSWFIEQYGKGGDDPDKAVDPKLIDIK